MKELLTDKMMSNFDEKPAENILELHTMYGETATDPNDNDPDATIDKDAIDELDTPAEEVGLRFHHL